MASLFYRAFSRYIDSYKGFSFHAWVGFLAAFANALCGGMTFLFSFYLARHLGVSLKITGTVISCFGFGTVVGAYVGGILCDRISSFKICILTLCANAVFLYSFPYLHSYHQFFMIAFLIGLANYAFIPAIRVWLMSGCSPEVRLKAMNILRMITNIGLGLSVWVSSSLAYYDFSYAFFFCAFFLGLFAFILLCYGDKQKYHHDSPHHSVLKQQSQDTGSQNNIYVFYFCLLMMGFVFSQLKISYPLYLNSSYHLNTRDFGHIFIINTIIVVLFQSYILEVLSKISHIILAGIGCLLIGSSMFFLSFGNTMLYAILLCIAWSLGEILFFSPTQVIIFNKAGSKSKGKYMGTYQMIYAAANILGPIGGGFIYHHFSGDAVWDVCGVIGITSLVLCFSAYFSDFRFFQKFSHNL